MLRRHPVVLFLLLTLFFSAPFYALLNLAHGTGEGRRLYVAGLMWCPALAAWLACRAGRIPLSALGWRWGGARHQSVAYLVPLAYGAVAYAIIWFTGLGALSLADYLPWARRALGLAQAPAWAVLALMLGLQISVGFLLGCATALGEEIGWRGFLAPRLMARCGFGGAGLWVGLIWALWHVPVYFLANYPGDPPRAFAIVCFTVNVVGLSYFYAWLRLRSGSLWTAVFLHASHNAVIGPVYTLLTADTGATAYAVDETGFMLALTSLVLAGWAWRRRSLIEAAPASAT